MYNVYKPWCVQTELSLVKHGQKSKVRTVLILRFSKLSLLFIFDHVLPKIIEIEHTKDKKKIRYFFDML